MNKKIYLDFSYLIALAATFGAIIVLGAFVAPVVFHTEKLLIDLAIDNYNAGIIMGEIFHRFSYWANGIAFFVLIYEAIEFKLGSRDRITLSSAIVVVSSSLLFSQVYAPKILSMQALGAEATQSETFQNIHTASEIDFKVLAVALIVLFVRRLMLLRRT